MARRMGMVVAVRPGKLEEYKRLHAEPWPEMNAALTAANITNYSIFLREPESLLFGYWEYVGTDHDADMKWLGEQDVTRRWLALTDPCQSRLETAGEGEWWSSLEEIFHLQ